MDNWGAQIVQAVWFYAGTDAPNAGRLYHLIVGEDADTTQNNKNPTHIRRARP